MMTDICDFRQCLHQIPQFHLNSPCHFPSYPSVFIFHVRHAIRCCITLAADEDDRKQFKVFVL
jgi:hypothetical protein